jgi:hypothetical protein
MAVPSTNRPALLVVGSYHMNNPGLDAFNLVADDVLTPRRQAEIQEVVGRLAAFRPTHVGLECPRNHTPDWQRDYAAYRAGAFTLTRDERHQIGFRVAEAAGLAQVTCVDWNWDDEGETGPDPGDPWAYAATHQPDLHRRITVEGEAFIAEMAERLASGTVRDVFRWLNSPEQEEANHRVYLGTLPLVGDDHTLVGVSWLAGWYRRNLTIFTNLLRLASSPDARIFTVYGSGHVPLLRQFAHLSGIFRVEEVRDYL